MNDTDIAKIAHCDRWPRQLAALTDLVADAIGGDDPWKRRVSACAVVTRITQEFGGSHLYVPKTDAIRRALRDLAIWAQHDGTAHGPRGIHALAAEHKMTANAIWDILREQRRLHKRRAFEARW